MSCIECYNAKLPKCVETFTLWSYLAANTNYYVLLTDRFGKTYVQEVQSGNEGQLQISLADLPKGFSVGYSGNLALTIKSNLQQDSGIEFTVCSELYTCVVIEFSLPETSPNQIPLSGDGCVPPLPPDPVDRCDFVDECLGINRASGRINYVLNERGQWVLMTGGGGAGCANNGLSIDNNGCVVLGGTLTQDTIIAGTDNYAILFGDPFQSEPFIALGNLSALGGDPNVIAADGWDDFAVVVSNSAILFAQSNFTFANVRVEQDLSELEVGDIFSIRRSRVSTNYDPISDRYFANMSAISGNGIDFNYLIVDDIGIGVAYFNTVTGDEYSFGVNDFGFIWESDDFGGAIMVLSTNGDCQLPAYPNTRDDSSVHAPTNFLYTDPIGNVLSAPLTLIGGVQSITGLQVVGGNTATPNIAYPDPTTMRTVLWTDLTGFTGSTSSPLAGSGLAAIEFGDWSILRSSGTNSTTTLTAEVGRNGILRMGVASVSANVSLRARSINIGAGKRFITAVRIPALSTLGQTFIVRSGDTAQNADANNSTYFRYTESVNGGRWQFIARDSVGNETIVDTGVTVVASTWYVLEYFCTNSGLTLNWSINGSIPQQVTSNVPLGQNSVIQIAIEKTNGSTERTLDVDFAYYHYNR